MPVYLDKKTKKYYASFYQQDWMGNTKRILKRGFATKKEARKYEYDELAKASGDLNMDFDVYVDLYLEDIQARIKLSTYDTKVHIIQSKIVPYFNHVKVSNIKPADILKWQNKMISLKKGDGTKYSPVYLKTINNQLSAIFNHAVRFYGLSENPVAKAGSIGKKKNREMQIWTKDEYLQFAKVMMDKPIAYYGFEILYWGGLRLGEMLALTKEDFDFTKNTVKISKSYMRRKGEDYITSPKTEKSNRTVDIPPFLASRILEHIHSMYALNDNDRIFPVTKHFFEKAMKEGAKKADVKKIRIHDLSYPNLYKIQTFLEKLLFFNTFFFLKFGFYFYLHRSDNLDIFFHFLGLSLFPSNISSAAAFCAVVISR